MPVSGARVHVPAALLALLASAAWLLSSPVWFQAWLTLSLQGVHDHLEATAQKRWVVSPDLGFVSTCPSNLGTTFVIEVMVALPTGGRDTAMLRGAVDHLLLALEKMEDDEDAAEGDAQTWKLSHKKAFGVSELAVVEKMVEGIELLASAAAQLPALPSR